MKLWLLAVAAVALVINCSDPSSTDAISSRLTPPEDVPPPPPPPPLVPCALDPQCIGPDPSPGAAGYWMGTEVSAATCVSPTGVGITDVDDDALHDFCENLLALKFRPALRFSVYDCDVGMEPYWAAKSFPNQGNVVRVAYLFSYYRDCGSPNQNSVGCLLQEVFGRVFTFNGLVPDYMLGPLPVSPEQKCDGHQGDSEFITLDLRFDGSTQHWYVSQAFFAAHWMVPGNSSESVSGADLEYPQTQLGYPLVWVAYGKHGSYRSRDACNNGGFADSDDCNSNSTNADVRLYYSNARNVGSAVSNLINSKTCVKGGELVQYYPEQYGIECYWEPGNTFAGWARYPLTTDASPYNTVLMVQFECYTYTINIFVMTCSDWGVRPSQNRNPPPPPSLSVDLAGPSTMGPNDVCWFRATAHGAPPYTYVWQNGGFVQTTSGGSSYASGGPANITVSVSDAAGNQADASAHADVDENWYGCN